LFISGSTMVCRTSMCVGHWLLQLRLSSWVRSSATRSLSGKRQPWVGCRQLRWLVQWQCWSERFTRSGRRRAKDLMS